MLYIMLYSMVLHYDVYVNLKCLIIYYCIVELFYYDIYYDILYCITLHCGI